jgi:membrane protein implicated in regulation of membrane protease activity
MQTFDKLAEILANIDPWWMVACALLLILVDWFYAQTDALMVVGFALIICSIVNAMGFSGQFQLWFMPFSLFISYFTQRKIFTLLTSSKSPYSESPKLLVGETGIIVINEIKNESDSYFYEYKKNIHVEDQHEIVVTKILKVILDVSGETYPAIDHSSKIKNGQKVVVVAEINGSLSVITEEK